MRVLFSSTWGVGHVFPMVPLAQACLGAGHDVLWAAPEPARSPVEAAGIPYAAAGLDGQGVNELVQRNRLHMQERAPEAGAAFAFPNMFGTWATPAMTEQLLPLARAWRPDVLVHEAGELSSPLVGAVVGVPSVTHAFGGAVPAAFVTEAGERLESLWAEHGVDLPPYAGCFAAPYLDICPPSVQPVDLSHIPARQPLRPVTWTGQRLPEPLPYLQETDKPLVYLTLGTVNNRATVLHATLEALADLPVRVLATTGPGGDPGALGCQPQHVTVERWVPQSQVLEHAAVVVSHAGSGTFLGTLAVGRPQLCLPQGADQFRNTGAGVRRGAAIGLSPDQATGETIATAVQRLLEETTYRANAEQVAGEITEMPSPAEAVAVLAALA